MPHTSDENSYSLWIGLVFVFNIIVGTGALTLPAAFAKAGWLFGTVSIVFLAFVSYINATYVIECMACANAVHKWKNRQIVNDSSVNADAADSGVDENTPIFREESTEQDRLLSVTASRYFSLDRRVELGEMASLFFSPVGRIVFYVTMVVYLFGDLSIYSAAIAKSTMDVICQSHNNTTSGIPDDLPCLGDDSDYSSFSRLQCYRIILLIFVIVLGPFVFFNVQKTKYLQVFTSLMRWLAFGTMIILAIRSLIKNGAQGTPSLFDMSGVPALFGACIYSFMCHHSLPGVIAPITSKKKLYLSVSLDFFLITVFYLLLAITGIFAFKELEDLYTLNFAPSQNDDGVFLKMIEYFLALFPVFTLSTTFPIVAITLRNNIQSIFLDMSRIENYNIVLRQLLFPFVAILPPIAITMFFEDVTTLVSFTGSYAGTGVQYLIPTFLVLCARRECRKAFGPNVVNSYQSPFKHVLWTSFIITWSIICVIMVSLNFRLRNPVDNVLLLY